MEGKKIAFIVVAVATVGGIGYFLYKRNKQVSEGGFASQVAKLPDWAKAEPKYVSKDQEMRVTIEENAPIRRGSSKTSTGYFKTE